MFRITIPASLIGIYVAQDMKNSNSMNIYYLIQVNVIHIFIIAGPSDRAV
jgi:hypothetical protein